MNTCFCVNMRPPLERGETADFETTGGMTALIAAALEQQVDSMAELVRNGAKVDRQNGAGLTAAAVAAMAGKPASLTQLCALGADMNFENKNAQTPLTLACKYAESTRAPYPTLIAERDDVMGAVDRLAELGAAVDFETKGGHTALGVAAAAGAHNTCAHLIDMGACVDRVSAKGMSALMLAACAQLADLPVARVGSAPRPFRRPWHGSVLSSRASRAGLGADLARNRLERGDSLHRLVLHQRLL